MLKIVSVLILFIMLYLLLKRQVLPRILSGLERRTRQIEQEMEGARQQREVTERMREESAARLLQADQETQAMLDASGQRVVEQREQLMREWELQVESQTQQFREDVARSRRQAIQEIRAQSADLVVAETEKLLHQQMDADDTDTRVDGAIESPGNDDAVPPKRHN
ncbi:ATP synthase F0 subunit B [Mariprofundus ferrooxydans]|uniref:ATP synthase subunit b n=1 Tax=Mariprofundus ferrooxydans PV-1 TaxID=314345 RepID=Q0EZI7_9PROT|nr:ATP synthase F0 subunit B [Mariprofundus ferrooxydans]EAU54717.1 ATP synthase F0, B subunit [Mariprofundus ferrooxydans PV-1]KON46728.1 ATP synthase F0 subunit B [Mariprofundus ferrooxydans]